VLLLAVLGLVVFGLLGCGKMSPTAPGEDAVVAQSAEAPPSGLPQEAIWPKMMVSSDTVYVEGTVSERRWSFLNLDLPGMYHWFIVPSGAVQETETITIAIVRNTYWDEQTHRWSYMAQFDFKPDGLVFNPWRQPRLLIDAVWLDLERGEEAVLRYLDEKTGAWEEISSTKVRYRKVDFYIPHFSRYAISR
jgi:hypothetical protein